MEVLLMMAAAIIAGIMIVGIMIVLILLLIWSAVMLIKFIREELDI